MTENNFNLSGDEARFLLGGMTSQGMAVPGPLLPMATDLLVRLNNISLNQPPTQNISRKEQNDSDDQ